MSHSVITAVERFAGYRSEKALQEVVCPPLPVRRLVTGPLPSLPSADKWCGMNGRKAPVSDWSVRDRVGKNRQSDPDDGDLAWWRDDTAVLRILPETPPPPLPPVPPLDDLEPGSAPAAASTPEPTPPPTPATHPERVQEAARR